VSTTQTVQDNEEHIPEQQPVHDNSEKLNKVEYEEQMDTDKDTDTDFHHKDNSEKINKIEYSDIDSDNDIEFHHKDNSEKLNKIEYDSNISENDQEEIESEDEKIAAKTTTAPTASTASTKSGEDRDEIAPATPSPPVEEAFDPKAAVDIPSDVVSQAAPIEHVLADALTGSKSASSTPAIISESHKPVIPKLTIPSYAARNAVFVNKGPIEPNFIQRSRSVNSYEPYDWNRGTPTQADVVEKRNKVKSMMEHAWDGYSKKAWGASEVNPITGEAKNSELFGNSNTGLTIIDGLGTLYIMGLHRRFLEARDWIENELFFDVQHIVSYIVYKL